MNRQRVVRCLSAIGLICLWVSQALADTVTLSHSVNGTNFSWAGIGLNSTDGYNIEEASIDGKSDALDNFGGVRINGQLVYNAAVTSADRTFFNDESGVNLGSRLTFPEFTSSSGIRVTQSFLILDRRINDSAVARELIQLRNPTGSAITVEVKVFGNVGSDGDTNVITTSSDDITLNASDTFVISADKVVTSETEISDPAFSMFTHRPGSGKVAPSGLVRSGGDLDDYEVTYSSISVPANDSVYLALFYGISSRIPKAESLSVALSSLSQQVPNSLFSDLSSTERAKVINFDMTPSANASCDAPLAVVSGERSTCAVEFGDCFMSVGTVDGTNAGGSIENTTEFPVDSEAPCLNPRGRFDPSADSFVSFTQEVGRVGGFLYNGRTHTQPEFPGYLAPSGTSLPPSFPVAKSAQQITAIIKPGPTPYLDLHLSVSRFGSESARVRLLDDDGSLPLTQQEPEEGHSTSPFFQPILDMILAGGGERVHVTHQLTAPDFFYSRTHAMALEISDAGNGNNNGFYLDHFGMRSGPGSFGLSGQDPSIGVPITLFTLGKKNFLNSESNAHEFVTKRKHVDRFTYDATFNSDDEEQTPELPGVISPRPVTGIGSAGNLEIKFTLNNSIDEAWVIVQSYGSEPLDITVDGLKVDTVAGTSTSRLTQFNSYLQYISAGEHTLSLSGSGVRYLDYIELQDRSSEAEGLAPAPFAPIIKRALFRDGRLSAKLALGEDSQHCTVRLFGGVNPLLANKLLAYVTPKVKKTALHIFAPKRGRSKKYFVRAVKSCPGQKNAISNLQRVRVRR